MSCAIGCIRWLLFIFNFVFSLCGLALLICGVIVHVNIKDIAKEIQVNVQFPAIAVIVIGCVIFVIAFFGCCGAVKESHCMIVTFSVLLLTILVIQIAVAIFAFVKLKGISDEEFRREYKATFIDYWTKEPERDLVDVIQGLLDCCGVDGPNDFSANSEYPHMNGTIPSSCCAPADRPGSDHCTTIYYERGCSKTVTEVLRFGGKLIGGVALGIAAVEVVGIVFALLLANSIRNADRRAYRV